MNNFVYYQPTSVEQAVGLLDPKSYGNTELLGGGTDLLNLAKDNLITPKKVISLSAIDSLGGIEIGNATVRIGASTRLGEIAAHEQLRKQFPVLTTPIGDIGGPQIRNMGTLGGNLCQRTRCWYFRDEQVNCLLKGGAQCFAVSPAAQNRLHAIFTQGLRCVMVHPSTVAPALIALDAKAIVIGPKGQREIPLAEFYRAPSSADQREHVLNPDEMVRQVEFVAKPTKNASYEVRQRYHHDWPFVQATVAFEDNDGKAKGARVVLGHVAPTPLLAEKVMMFLEGKAITEEVAEQAGKLATEGARPLAQNAYKVKLLEVAVKRALLAAVGNRYWEA